MACRKRRRCLVKGKRLPAIPNNCKEIEIEASSFRWKRELRKTGLAVFYCIKNEDQLKIFLSIRVEM